MKKLAPRISNKRGSMLMLTLIVFMVILILGMTMITSMLYSQGENNMQINEQKAYYAAFSAVEAVKSYFLNPDLNVSENPSITSPYDLIGKTCSYTLEGQEIEENTTVTLNISRQDDQYILIEATGVCNGEKSIVTAKMREEVDKGSSGGLYGSGTVIACNEFVHNFNNSYKLNIEGNLFLNDAGVAKQNVIESINLIGDGNKGGDLFIHNRSTTPTTLKGSDVNNVFLVSNGQLTIGDGGDSSKGNVINNIYVKRITKDSNAGITFQRNIVKGDAQFFLGNTSNFNITHNSSIKEIKNNEGKVIKVESKNIEELIISVNTQYAWTGNIQNNEVNRVYIRGVHQLAIEGKSSTNPIQVLYTDAKQYVNYPFTYINKVINKDLSELDTYKQKIDSVMESVNPLSEVLEAEDQERPKWSKPDESSGFIKFEQVNEFFEEYYNENKGIRLVFCNPNRWGGATIKIKKGSSTGPEGWANYIISDADKQIFFISESGSMSFDFENQSTNDIFNGVHIYAPKSQIKFCNHFTYFKGSIIANKIYTDSIKGTFIFEEPTIVDGMGVPGGTGSSGSSSGTTYTYHFEEYIEKDK